MASAQSSLKKPRYQAIKCQVIVGKSSSVLFGDQWKMSGAPINRFLDRELLDSALRDPAKFAHRAQDLNLPLYGGMTPLTAAVRCQDAAAVEALLRAGANASLFDTSGYTPLIYAARYNSTSIAKLLLAGGADVNGADQNLRTPAHFAAAAGHSEFLSTLHASSANFNVRDLDGRTVLDYARAVAPGKRTEKIEKLVRDFGGRVYTPLQHRRSPLRSDGDFMIVDLVYRMLGKPVRDLKSYLIAAFGAIIGAFVAALLNGEPLYPLHAYWGGLLVTLIAFAIPFLMQVFLPSTNPDSLVNRSEMARLITLGDSNAVPTNPQDFGDSDTATRSIAGLLKRGSRLAHNELMRRTAAASMLNPTLILATGCIVLLPAIPLSFFLPYVMFAAVFAVAVGNDIEDKFGSVIGAGVGIAAMYLFIRLGMMVFAISQQLAFELTRFLYKRRMLKRQKVQAALMREFLRDKATSEGQANPFVLYLRSFVQDSARRIGPFSFEAALSYSLSRVCPVVAIGFSESHLGPLNVDASSSAMEGSR